MKIETKTVKYEDGKQKIKLVVSEATSLIGMQRAILKGRASAFLESREDTKHEDALTAAYMLVMLFQFPDLQAATVKATGLTVPMSPEEFCSLPQRLVNAWDEADYALNPHWLPVLEETAAAEQPEADKQTAEKKETKNTSASESA